MSLPELQEQYKVQAEERKNNCLSNSIPMYGVPTQTDIDLNQPELFEPIHSRSNPKEGRGEPA